MNSSNKIIDKSLRLHPYKVFTYLMLAGITSAFFTLSASYFSTTVGTTFNNFELPAIFHANTIIILVSSYSMHQTRIANVQNNAKGYADGLLITSLLGIAFTIFQFIGWKELLNNGIALQNNVAGAYLYVISGLHLLHLVAGVAVLFVFWLKAKERETDAVKELLFDTNPVEKLKVKCLAIYWHFVDGLWIYLYLFFLLNIYLLREARY